MEKGRIKIIGTSHISPESIKQIENVIRKEMPNCVAVELDPGRFHGLLRKETISIKSIKQIGFRNYFVAKIFSMIQQHFGKKTGIMPGEEMLTAIKMAREAKSDLVLIDQDIQVTLEKIRKIPFMEKFKLFLGFFRRGETEEKFDLRKVPVERVVEKVLDELKKTSPSLYKVLVEERDYFMARHLFELSQKYEKTIAVVGTGHKRGILKALKELERDKKKLDRKIVKYRMGSGPSMGL